MGVKLKVVVDRRIRKECERVSKIKNSCVGEMLELNGMSKGTLQRATCDHADGNLILTSEIYKKICKVFNITDDRFLAREMSREESKEYYMSPTKVIWQGEEETPEPKEETVEPQEVVVVEGTPNVIPTIFENLYDAVMRLSSETRQLRAVVETIAADNKRTADNIMLNGKAVDELTDEVKELTKVWRA